MRSNVCKIEKGTKDLEKILKESEKVAVYNELDRKQTMQLRLLCEELDGMLPELVGDFEGDFYIEMENGVCKVNASIELREINLETKNQLIDMAKNKRNAAASGIVGKIRSSMENFFLDDEYTEPDISLNYYGLASDYDMGMGYAYYWSLGQYKSAVKKETEAEAWDELEKSVIVSVADDIIVGIKGRHADITIIKKFD